MKGLLIALTLAFATPAFADYFSCEIQNGFNKTSAEAEYQGRRVSVTQRPFTCEGVIYSDATVGVRITSTEVPEESAYASGRGSASATLTSLDIHGDGQDTGTCTCGLN